MNTNIAIGLAKIGTYLRSAERRSSERSGLTATQAQILVHLVARGPARVTAVAEEIAVTQPTASDAVMALERKKLVEKRADPIDSRAIRLHPTPRGKRIADLLAIWPDALLGAIDALQPNEQAAFLKGLTKMIRNLQLRGAIPVQHMCVTCRFFRPNVHDDLAAPHHCDFVDAAFGDAELRIDRGDHESATQTNASIAWRRFAFGDGAKRAGA